MLQLSRKKWVVILIVIAVVTFFLLQIREKHHHHMADHVSVSVALVKSGPMPIVVSVPGNIEPLQSVAVKAQINGMITKINFSPGDKVVAGQSLFEINPGILLASLAKAQANLLKDQAQLNNTLKDQARFKSLVSKGYVSRQEYDQLIAQASMQSATAQADLESLKQIRVQLDYAHVHAPIAGKTGNVTVKIGDLVQSDGKNTLVTINELDPVLVNFNVSQNQFAQLLKYHHKKKMLVEVWSDDSKTQLAKGLLSFVDNTVNSDTGTVLLKGLIPNQQHLLWPLQMVNVKLILAIQQNAIIIPSRAINLDNEGAFVYVVKQGKAVVTRIKVDRQIGSSTVVADGLQVNDEVVTVAPPNLDDGQSVKVITG